MNRNVASGSYSTAIGYHNTATATGSFAAGNGNNAKTKNSFLIGTSNSSSGGTGTTNNWLIGDSNRSSASNSNTFAFGRYNMLNYHDAFAYGHNNTINHEYAFAFGSFLTSHNHRMHLYGRLNENSTYLTNPIVVIGSANKITNSDPETVTAFEANNQGLVRLPHGLCLDSNTTIVNAIDTPINTPASTTDKTLATLGSFQKRYQSWYSSIVFTPDVAKSTADLPSGFQAALYQATEAEFIGTYWGVQVRAKFRLSPNSDETILANPVVCYNTDGGAYSHSRGFILKLEKSSSAVTITMQKGTSIDFGNNDNTFNSYVDSTTTFNVSYIQLKMTNF